MDTPNQDLLQVKSRLKPKLILLLLLGNFIKFSDDLFGVMFLEIRSFSIFKRVEETDVMNISTNQ